MKVRPWKPGFKTGCALFLILNLVCGAPLSRAESDKLPTAVEEAARAIVKIHVNRSGGNIGHSAGFAVKSPGGETFIVADFGLSNMSFVENTEIHFETSSGQFLTGARTAAFDLANDLALFKAPNLNGLPVLPLSDSKTGLSAKKESTPAYHLAFVNNDKGLEKGSNWHIAPGFVSGDLRWTEIFGLAFDQKNSFYGYAYRIDKRGGPVIAENGAALGMINGFDEMGYSVFGTKSSALEKLLKSAPAAAPFTPDSALKELARQLNDLKSAAAAGDGEAAWTAARFFRNLYDNGGYKLGETADTATRRSFSIDSKEEHKKYRDLALKAGNSRAFYFSAVDWLQSENYEKALPALRGAADQGQSSAMFLLANALILGRMEETGIDKDLKAGAILMQKAAERQNPEAMGNLAAMYLLGEGLPKDTTKGMDLLLDLARKGFKPAQEALERLHGPAWTTLFNPRRWKAPRCLPKLFNGKQGLNW